MPYHCLGSIWSQRDKKGKEHLAPTIRATVAQFNNVANCVITTCLGDQSMKAPDRARVVEHWIEVARVGYRRGLGTSFLYRPQGHTARLTLTLGTVHLSCCVSECPWRALWGLPGVKEGLIHGLHSQTRLLVPRSAECSRISPPSTPSSLPCRVMPSTA